MANQKQSARSKAARAGSARTGTSNPAGVQAGRGSGGSASRTAANPTGSSGGRGNPATRNGSVDSRNVAGKAGSGAARGGSGSGGTGRSGGSGSGGTGRGATAVAAATPAAAGPLGWLLAPLRPFMSMTKLQLVTFLLTLYGLGASIYLTLTHYVSSVPLICSGRGLVNCAEVTSSPQSMVFGVIPVAVLGLAFYLFLTAINSPWGWRSRLPAVGWVRLGSLVVGMIFVLYLIWAELIKIGAICLWCTSVHVTTFLIFALVVFNASFTWGTLDDGRRR